jgi:NADH:ubiquinone oxidoreductase subunit F (NADH-binding)/NADH:ubiquinone oxidoreductase subunit E
MKKKPLHRKSIDHDIQALVEEHNYSPEALLSILTELQMQRGGLSQEIIEGVAQAYNWPPKQVNTVASFYTMLKTQSPENTIRICDGPVCWINGCAKVRELIEKNPPEGWILERSSCLGLCDRAPASLVGEKQTGPLDVESIKLEPNSWPSKKKSIDEPRMNEVRVLLENIEKIKPDDIQTAIGVGIYRGLINAIEMDPGDVIEQVKQSGLIGRGGAGFPTGLKWEFVRKAGGTEKYIVCNADESEPMAVKDRTIIEHNPYLLIEGITIAAYAVGAKEGFIYIRGEYTHQAELLEKAIRQVRERNLLGNKICGKDFSFDLHVHRGAGAYICGEETALLESLEGRRGEPRIRPPYPTTSGYRSKPTVVNNVETLSNVPAIFKNGVEWYQNLSEGKYAGTKIYAIFGHIKNPGIFEAPFGLTLRQIIDDFGGGMLHGSEFQFALAGGTAGRFVPARFLDFPTSFSADDKSIPLGIGAFLICDQTVSIVEFLRQLLHFFEMESCGKCTPCRVGTKQAGKLLDEIIKAGSSTKMLDRLKEISHILATASFCGLGTSVSWPINSALLHFEKDFLSYGN